MNEKACNLCGKMVLEGWGTACPCCGSPSPFPQNQGMRQHEETLIKQLRAIIRVFT